MALIVLAGIAVWGAVPAVDRVEAGPAGAIQIQAWYYDPGNARIHPNPHIYADGRDKFPELVSGEAGQRPWSIEYDIDSPAAATRTSSARAWSAISTAASAARTSRPSSR